MSNSSEPFMLFQLNSILGMKKLLKALLHIQLHGKNLAI
jgi:hypothetical protein